MLKIKKQIKNSDGTITELEGTEAEVEAFLKKQSKKDETVSPKKKNLILGKEMQAAVQQLIDEAITAHLLRFNHLNTHTVEHHWYQSNGWWWKPYWDQGRWTYMYTQNDPNTYTGIRGVTNTISSGIYTCNSSAELSSKLGLDAHHIDQQMGGAQNSSDYVLTTTSNSGVNTGNHLATIGSLIQDNFTSGMINANIKS